MYYKIIDIEILCNSKNILCSKMLKKIKKRSSLILIIKYRSNSYYDGFITNFRNYDQDNDYFIYLLIHFNYLVVCFDD